MLFSVINENIYHAQKINLRPEVKYASLSIFYGPQSIINVLIPIPQI